jgi:hypothetical protein
MSAVIGAFVTAVETLAVLCFALGCSSLLSFCFLWTIVKLTTRDRDSRQYNVANAGSPQISSRRLPVL